METPGRAKNQPLEENTRSKIIPFLSERDYLHVQTAHQTIEDGHCHEMRQIVK